MAQMINLDHFQSYSLERQMCWSEGVSTLRCERGRWTAHARSPHAALMGVCWVESAPDRRSDRVREREREEESERKRAMRARERE
jgi:hypothetical protein